ncbi:glycosyl transferase family 2 [Prevotella bivia DNF00650]|uniref:glycosyltransferase family 2 protein n=1 Tax=Prevotella bivia TaxID=28125 RepID=UPI00050E6E39|nr:glycosyltransferase family 2 protein [Prevotella bivia]KGF37182.1 glycosyl transferase family 2 [Prevotella bivia DNF00650]
MKRIAVVILNWNGRKMLEEFLPSVVAYSREEAEVIIADNASTDDSLAWLATHYPHLRTIVLDQNYGFADGYNKALEQVTDTDYYVLLNSDVEVTHHWLTPLLEAMDTHKDIAACQPKLLSYLNKDAFEYAGACGGYMDKYGYPYCRGRVFDTVEDDNGQYDHAQEILWATGACLMIRREYYWKAGGLDGKFFAHNEEIDLCWRLHNMGKKIYCLPESTVYHLGGGTLPKSNPRKTFLNFRNNLTMLWKNLPEPDLKSVMRMRLILDYVAAFQFLLLKRSWKECKAIIDGRRAFKQWRHEFPRNIQQSIKPQKGNRIEGQDDEQLANLLPDGRTNLFLLKEYYLGNRKRFSDLP